MTGSSSVAMAEGVSVNYNDAPVLENLSLTVAPKERLAVLGASGCGKTTLLHLFTGTQAPDVGTVNLFGIDLGTCKKAGLNQLRKRLGMVHQNAALISSLDVFDNVALPLREHTKMTKKEVQENVEERLEKVGLKDSIHATPAELSGGMKKRAAIARALALKPELLFLDEPLAGLDPQSSGQFDELIVKLAEQSGLTCILVTHELESAFRVATRMVMIHDKHLVEDGTPELFKNSQHPAVKKFLEGQK